MFIISCSKDDNNPTLNVYRIKQIINSSDGSKESFEYNAQNKVTQIAYKEGIFITYTYNSQGLMLTSENSGYVNISQNSITNYVYDTSGIKIEEIRIQGNGNKYKYVYTNSNGLPIESRYYNWNKATNNWVESTSVKLIYVYNSNNQVIKTLKESSYDLNAYDSRGNLNEKKSYYKKSDGTYYFAFQDNNTFDDKKAINYGSFSGGDKNNIVDHLSKTYLENGSLSNQYSVSYSYEYNEAGYVTKKYNNGTLVATFILEKIN